MLSVLSQVEFISHIVKWILAISSFSSLKTMRSKLKNASNPTKKIRRIETFLRLFLGANGKCNLTNFLVFAIFISFFFAFVYDFNLTQEISQTKPNWSRWDDNPFQLKLAKKIRYTKQNMIAVTKCSEIVSNSTSDKYSDVSQKLYPESVCSIIEWERNKDCRMRQSSHIK